MAGKQYIFPNLSAAEIVYMLNEMGFTLKDSDIQRPQPALMRQVYEFVVERLMGISTQELKQPSFDALSRTTDYDLIADALVHARFFRNLQKLMRAVGIHDFSTADVTKPVDKRTIRNFSAIINFAKFREERLVAYTECNAKHDLLIEEYNQVNAEVEALQDQLRLLRQKREREQPLVRQLEEEANELEEKIRNLNKLQATRKHETEELKEKHSKIADQLNTHKLQINHTKQEISRLQTLIVRSPEKIKKMLEDMATQLERERAHITEAEEVYIEHSKRTQRLTKIEKGVHKAIGIMKECDSEMEKLKKVTKEIKEKKSEIKQLEQLSGQLVANEKNISNKIEATQSKTTKLAQMYGARKAQAEKTLEEARAELQEMENIRDANRGKIDQNAVVLNKIQHEIDQIRSDHELEMHATKVKYDKLVSEVYAYHRQLRAAIRAA